MKALLTLIPVLALTGCVTAPGYPPPSVVVSSVAIGISGSSGSSYGSIGVAYGTPVYYGYPRYYSPYDSGPFGYSPEVQAHGSYYSPPIGAGGCGCVHRH